MARSTPLFSRLRQRAAAYRWRRVGVLAGFSLALSLALILYVFGTADHFFGRWSAAFFVGFSLLAVTFLAVIPFIGWATQHWFGPGWLGEEASGAKRRSAAASPLPPRRPAPRRSSTSTI